MKTKKNKEVSLERKRGLFRAIGLLTAATIVLAAFEYRTIKSTSTLEGNIPIPLEEEVAIISIPEKPEIPKLEKVVDLSFLIDNTAEEDPIEFDNLEIDPDQAIFASTDVVFEVEKIVEIDPPMIIPEVMPEFQGGLEAMYHYLGTNIKYPKQALDTHTQGRVYLSFIVEKDGSITNIKALNRIEMGCTEEAIRVVKSMPKWKAGEQFGKKVRVIFTLPVNFVLQ